MRLKEARAEQGYTQKEFARLLDVGQSYLSIVENGHYPLSPKLRRKASTILGLDPRTLE